MKRHATMTPRPTLTMDRVKAPVVSVVPILRRPTTTPWRPFLMMHVSFVSFATTLVQGLTCAGDANAQVTIDITNVTHPDLLVYFLNGDTVGGTMFDSLSAGTYTALVTEGAGCSALVNFTVNDGISLNVIAETTDVSCHGKATGLIDATVSNGQLPYTFELFGNATDVSNTGLFDDLMGGEYTLEVADANGCTGSVELEIDEPLGLSLDANITNASLRERVRLTDHHWRTHHSQ